MKWLDKLERRFGRFCIPRLMEILLCSQIVVWVVMLFTRQNVAALLTLSHSGVFAGQIWRLLTFMAIPLDTSVLGFLLGTYLLYLFGSALEAEWGSFRFDLYVLAGMAGCWLASLITGYCSGYWVYVSLFLAFAILFPEHQLLLFFVIPVRVKWLGWIAGGIWVLTFLLSGVAGKIQLVCAMLGFLLFFAPGVFSALRAWVRREQWRRKNKNNWNR